MNNPKPRLHPFEDPTDAGELLANRYGQLLRWAKISRRGEHWQSREKEIIAGILRLRCRRQAPIWAASRTLMDYLYTLRLPQYLPIYPGAGFRRGAAPCRAWSIMTPLPLPFPQTLPARLITEDKMTQCRTQRLCGKWRKRGASKRKPATLFYISFTDKGAARSQNWRSDHIARPSTTWRRKPRAAEG